MLNQHYPPVTPVYPERELSAHAGHDEGRFWSDRFDSDPDAYDDGGAECAPMIVRPTSPVSRIVRRPTGVFTIRRRRDRARRRFLSTLRRIFLPPVVVRYA